MTLLVMYFIQELEKMLESLVFKEFQCKVRSIELNVLQRCAMHIGSKTDLNESFVVGQKCNRNCVNWKIWPSNGI